MKDGKEKKGETSNMVLYRKYRPQKFSDVLGQENIVDTLQSAIKASKLGHAYIFAGGRGTGKTSLARILANALEVDKSDIYEIDAASHTGVDDIRELNEAVHTIPMRSKYKVYIIDEVHMLSKGAFNALLKTLEEPPSHVIFILATTEIEKVPETIISRCQVFQFRRPTHKILRDLVNKVAKEEKISLRGASSDLIALLGDGSFRDTLGILQKTISASGDREITPEEVERASGAPKNSLINKIVEAVAEKDADKGLSAIREASGQNADMSAFLRLILRKLRFILLLRYSPSSEREISLETSDEDLAFLKNLVGKSGANISSFVILEFLKASDLLAFAVIPEMPLEIAMVNVCQKSA